MLRNLKYSLHNSFMFALLPPQLFIFPSCSLHNPWIFSLYFLYIAFISLHMMGIPKSLIFHWFYTVFRLCGNAARKPSLGNAFSMILQAISALWPNSLPFSIGFIRYFNRVFRLLKKLFSIGFIRFFDSAETLRENLL